MAAYVPLSSRFSLKCNVGNDASGAPKLGSISIPHVDPAITADVADTVTTALGLLLSVTVMEVHRSTVDLIS